jgi:hypothetical protein
MSEHAKYSPSQLPRIIGCPGSTTIHKQTASSKYAEEGTKCHDIVAGHLEANSFTLDPRALKIFPVEDRPELGDAIQDCLDYTFGLLAQYPTGNMSIETHVSLEYFADSFYCEHLVDVHGTADLIIMVPSEKVIHIIDWKFGKGIEVYPDSDQLKAYGLAALKDPFLASKYDKAHLHIGQPRLYSGERFKVHETTPAKLLSWAGDELVPALNDANSGNPCFSPSEKACRWCYAKTFPDLCPTRFEKAQQTATDIFKVHAEMPAIIAIDELADFLVKSRELVEYVKDIEKFIANTIRGGIDVDGLKMVEGRSIRKWEDPKAFVEWADSNYPEYEIFESKPLSPAKAEKLFKRKIASTDEFKALIIKPEGKHTLVAESDPRQPISYETATDAFKEFAE